MPLYSELPRKELETLYEGCKQRYDSFRQKGQKLDMSRGRPGADQMDLALGLFNCLSPEDYQAADGTDCRNYGGIDGLPEMKTLFADYMDVAPEEVIVGGNSSLAMMFDAVALFYPMGGRKFLCPAPGYDRHFAICEHQGIDMIPIDMTPAGPDMEQVRRHIADPAVAGIWCVPVFSNPQGYVYADETIRALAEMAPAAADFRIFWDNAYALHAFEGKAPQPANILRLCQQQGAYNRPLIFASFSKISFAGAAVCAMAASPENLAEVRHRLGAQTIGPDKINQLRHIRFFKDIAGVRAHMDKHAELLRPKFAVIERQLAKHLGGKGIGTWLKPAGGYFVSFDTLPGCAQRALTLCAEAGLTMTPAGAAFPYGHDPQDSNVRIAPTLPPLSQLETAMELFCLAVEMAALEKLGALPLYTH